MAMRPRYRSGNQPRQPMRQTYENFRPKSEWKYEDDAIFLLVFLPGFVEEQVKVVFTYVDNITVAAKVEGRRPLGGGRWSKFSELYKIPETCDINKISSLFQRGVLTIIMPKIKIVEPEQDSSESEATSSPPQEIAETSALLERQGEEKQKSVEDLLSPNKKVTTSEEKSEKGQGETSQQTASLIEDSKPEVAQEMSSPQEAVLAETSQKSVEALSPNKKVTTSGEEKSQKGKDETSQKSAYQKVEEKSSYEKVEEKSQVGHQVEDSLKTHHEKKEVEISDGKSAYRKADEKEKQPAEVEAAAVAQKTEDEKPKSDRIKEEDDLIAEKLSKDTKHESSASASEGLIEGKQLLVNMGAAALVIMGLGAYLSYTVLSFGKP